VVGGILAWIASVIWAVIAANNANNKLHKQVGQ
jgi:hypothetical protein